MSRAGTDESCVFPGCVSTDRHWHGPFPGGYANPADPAGPPIPFTSEPAPGVRDYNGALLEQPETTHPYRVTVRDPHNLEFNVRVPAAYGPKDATNQTLERYPECVVIDTPQPIECECGYSPAWHIDGRCPRDETTVRAMGGDR